MIFRAILEEAWKNNADPAHDMGHILRVVKNAEIITHAEGGDLAVITPAAWLHDIVNIPKDSPDRSRASTLAADMAVEKLRGAGYAAQYLDAIHHAIAAHSFSANIAPQTIEAKIVQDADRLESLGAIGIARMFSVGGALGRAMFDYEDPLAAHRDADDTRFGLDHFQVKLFRVAQTLQTKTARAMAQGRVDFMKDFAAQIARENLSQA